MIYITILSVLILIRYSLGSYTQFSKIIYPYVLIGLYIFAAFRFEVGCDWGNYRMLHLVTAQPLEYLGLRVFTEPFFVFSSKFLHYFNLDYYWINVISTSAFFYGAHKLAIRTPDPLAFIILLFPILIINMPMSAVKQGAAVGILCLAYTAFIDKQLIKYTLLTILAGGFHLSALIFLVFVPFLGGDFTIKRFFFGVMISIPILALIVASSFAEHALERYTESDSPESSGAIFRVGILVISSLVFFVFFKNKWKIFFNEQYKLIVLGSLMSIALLLVMPVSSVIADRVGYYLIPILTLFFAGIPYIPKIEYRAMWISFPYLMLLSVFAVWTSFSYHFSHCYKPYKSWIIEVPEREDIMET